MQRTTIHSMSSSADNYDKLEKESALNFVSQINKTKAQQVIYLSELLTMIPHPKHLSSRKSRRNFNFGDLCYDHLYEQELL
jgi:hypothetical protein